MTGETSYEGLIAKATTEAYLYSTVLKLIFFSVFITFCHQICLSNVFHEIIISYVQIKVLPLSECQTAFLYLNVKAFVAVSSVILGLAKGLRPQITCKSNQHYHA